MYEIVFLLLATLLLLIIKIKEEYAHTGNRTQIAGVRILLFTISVCGQGPQHRESNPGPCVRSARCYHYTMSGKLDLGSWILEVLQGIEPWSTVPKTVVLPLYYRTYGHTGARTQDLGVISTALYQLSYTTTFFSFYSVYIKGVLPIH